MYSVCLYLAFAPVIYGHMLGVTYKINNQSQYNIWRHRYEFRTFP
jgi:hypothetical protein